MSGSEWSSGCESGWTVYLDESSHSDPNQHHKSTRNNANFHQNHGIMNSTRFENDEEEDLSMVSDASSGPPHLVDDEECYTPDRFACHFYPTSETCRKNGETMRYKSKEQKDKKLNFGLHDTASSKMCVSSSNNQVLGFSQNLSEAKYKGNSALNNHRGFWQSRNSKKSDSAEPSQLRGRQ